MKQFFFIIQAIIAAFAASAAQPADSLHYDVNYRWGFINKNVASALITVKQSGDTLTATMSGHSIPWGGRIYSIRDSLSAVISAPSADSPAPAESVIYENGIYTKPMVQDTPAGRQIERNSAFRDILGHGTLSASPETMEAITITADMLSLFRICSLVNFADMNPGDVIRIPITGTSPGALSIRFIGTAPFTIGDDNIFAGRHIVFTYEYNGKPDAYPVDAIIDSKTGTPLQFSASIKIGHMTMTLDPR